MEHWAVKYIGLPWARGGIAGAYNCWELGQLIYQRELGIELPTMQADGKSILQAMREFSDNPEYTNWEEVFMPEDFDAVLMRKGKLTTHIGWFSHIGIIHSLEGCGSIRSSAQDLHDLGFQVAGIWRRKNA